MRRIVVCADAEKALPGKGLVVGVLSLSDVMAWLNEMVQTSGGLASDVERLLDTTLSELQVSDPSSVLVVRSNDSILGG